MFQIICLKHDFVLYGKVSDITVKKNETPSDRVSRVRQIKLVVKVSKHKRFHVSHECDNVKYVKKSENASGGGLEDEKGKRCGSVQTEN